jgi:hypothetical protein
VKSGTDRGHKLIYIYQARSIVSNYISTIRRRGWMDIIKMDLSALEWGCMDTIDLSQDRDMLKVLVNTVINLRVP